MAQLTTYEDFIRRVDEIGFMTLSEVLPGLPSLSVETSKEAWHTGDAETDPWQWKDRAAEEKRLAFGCIVGGHKGFVAARMYPIFHAAYHPRESMEYRRDVGLVSQTVWQLWQLFEGKPLLNTSEIRQELGVSKKKGSSRVDAALKELQQHYYITVAGNRRKLDKKGEPYGWPANVYDKVINWVPMEWMKAEPDLQQEEARGILLNTGIAIGNNLGRKELAKILGI